MSNRQTIESCIRYIDWSVIRNSAKVARLIKVSWGTGLSSLLSLNENIEIQNLFGTEEVNIVWARLRLAQTASCKGSRLGHCDVTVQYIAMSHV